MLRTGAAVTIAAAPIFEKLVSVVGSVIVIVLVLRASKKREAKTGESVMEAGAERVTGTERKNKAGVAGASAGGAAAGGASAGGASAGGASAGGASAGGASAGGASAGGASAGGTSTGGATTVGGLVTSGGAGTSVAALGKPSVTVVNNVSVDGRSEDRPDVFRATGVAGSERLDRFIDGVLVTIDVSTEVDVSSSEDMVEVPDKPVVSTAVPEDVFVIVVRIVEGTAAEADVAIVVT